MVMIKLCYMLQHLVYSRCINCIRYPANLTVFLPLPAAPRLEGELRTYNAHPQTLEQKSLSLEA